MPIFKQRQAVQSTITGLSPVLARILAARGITNNDDYGLELAKLIPPNKLKGMEGAAAYLADALASGKRIIVVADYDCDGATACAVAVRGLLMLGFKYVDFLVPNRFLDGYGLTPGIVDQVVALKDPHDIILTVDNGIASVAGVAHANAKGLEVLITDHHLPGDETPPASHIVNPNQRGCEFPSKNLAGVGVMFYTLLAVRTELRNRGAFTRETQPRLEKLLDIVGLGTVADVVSLDRNNRILVNAGINLIRSGRAHAGINALYKVCGKDPGLAVSTDMGFLLGPRINAAGRMNDMTVGIRCLLSNDEEEAANLARELHALNGERRSVEEGIQAEAGELLKGIEIAEKYTICLTDDTWHQGVIGIVAGRLKELHHRPAIIFADAGTPETPALKGSGRSIPGFHLRDALDLVSKRHPEIIVKFGGHAMAAGCTLLEDDLATFEFALQDIAVQWLDAATLAQTLATDGSLPLAYLRPDMVKHLQAQVWGQGFAQPMFQDTVNVLSQKIVGEKHLSLKLQLHGQLVDAIWFGRTESLPVQATVAYRLDINTWQGMEKLQLQIEAMQPFYN